MLGLCLLTESCMESRSNNATTAVFDLTNSPDASLVFELNNQEKTLAQQIDSFYKKLSVASKFNGNVLVAKNHRIIYRNSFGWQNYKEKILLTTQTRFELASVSKQFTAVAIMLLKQQGKLSYSDSVQKYFPDFPYKGITIKDLLTHRSGLPVYTYFCDQYIKRQDTLLSNQDIIDIMAKYKPAGYGKPNKQFMYNNTNYIMLARIVEKVSGLSFPAFMQQKVFTPIAMAHSYIKNKRQKTFTKDEAIGYTTNFREYGFDKYDACYGDKGVFTTIEDMFKWDEMLRSEILLKKEILQEAFTPYSNEKKGNRNYGFGFRMITENDTAKIIYHNGWWHGYRTLFYRRLADNSTIVAMSNTTNKSVYNIRPVLEMLSKGNGVVEEMEE